MAIYHVSFIAFGSQRFPYDAQGEFVFESSAPTTLAEAEGLTARLKDEATRMLHKQQADDDRNPLITSVSLLTPAHGG